jgi:hypothetical protein
MAHLFRSEDMIYVRLTISKEAAHDTIRSLGAFGNLHFVDLNEGDAVLTEDFKYFKKRVVACDYWERKLRALEEEMRRNDITVPAPGSYQLDEFNGGDVLNELKNNLDAVELELQRNNEFREAQTRELNDLRERQLVLENAGRAVAARVTDFELRQVSAGAAMVLSFFYVFLHSVLVFSLSLLSSLLVVHPLGGPLLLPLPSPPLSLPPRPPLLLPPAPGPRQPARPRPRRAPVPPLHVSAAPRPQPPRSRTRAAPHLVGHGVRVSLGGGGERGAGQREAAGAPSPLVPVYFLPLFLSRSSVLSVLFLPHL